MFYEIFIDLCKKSNVKPATVAREAGFRKGATTYWKTQYEQNKDVRPDARILEKIAVYFGVTVDYLLERPTSNGTAEVVDIASAASKDSQISNLINLFTRLDHIDRTKAESFIQGLLAADKYAENVKMENA